MGTLRYVNYLIPYKEWIEVTIKAPKIWNYILYKMDGLARAVLEISGSKIYQLYLMLDDTEAAKTSVIYYRYYVKYKKGWDEHTNFWIYVKTNGWQNMKTKEGEALIKMSPYLETKFKYSNNVVKSLIKAYHHFYYDKRIISLIKDSKDLAYRFFEEIKSEFGVSKYDKNIIEAWRMSK